MASADTYLRNTRLMSDDRIFSGSPLMDDGTTVEMPLNAVPPTVNTQALALKVRPDQSLVDYMLWGWISDLQSVLSAMLTEGVVRHGLSLPYLAGMISTSPARIMGIYPRMGTARPGSDADLVIVDPDCAFCLRVSDLQYRNAHSAYVGKECAGKVARTFRRGQT
ncbi:amidohydrolase family protein [Qingshengfaniella alkalisoli]|nr:amidohydrolase family protein [Qingshengfaniella alkalisoli]